MIVSAEARRVGKSVTGRVLDNVKKEVIGGAKCTLFNDQITLKQSTDQAGCFKFEGVDAGFFKLKVMAPGCLVKMYVDRSTETDNVDMGDMELVVNKSWVINKPSDL
jgi:hypothetical protein